MEYASTTLVASGSRALSRASSSAERLVGSAFGGPVSTGFGGGGDFGADAGAEQATTNANAMRMGGNLAQRQPMGHIWVMAPRDALVLLRTLGGSPWLIRHHELVVEAATLLCDGLHGVAFDRGAVLAGAALHDAGKIVHPGEQSTPGHQHEAAGHALLVAHGVPEAIARFCITHAAWSDGAIEDLLVAAADKLWKGKRDTALEQALVAKLASITGEPAWATFDRVDTLCDAIAADGETRLSRSVV